MYEQPVQEACICDNLNGSSCDVPCNVGTANKALGPRRLNVEGFHVARSRLLEIQPSRRVCASLKAIFAYPAGQMLTEVFA